MIKRFMEKLSNLREDKKGFTLVELIVVVLILGILMVVSVQGYTKYVGMSRINTDNQSAETVKSAFVNAMAEPGVYEELVEVNSTEAVDITWSEATPNNGYNIRGYAKFEEAVKNCLVDGLPAIKQDGKQFHLSITPIPDKGIFQITITIEDK